MHPLLLVLIVNISCDELIVMNRGRRRQVRGAARAVRHGRGRLHRRPSRQPRRLRLRCHVRARRGRAHSSAPDLGGACRQPSAVKPSAAIRQPSSVSRQTSAVVRQPSSVSHQTSDVSHLRLCTDQGIAACPAAVCFCCLLLSACESAVLLFMMFWGFPGISAFWVVWAGFRLELWVWGSGLAVPQQVNLCGVSRGALCDIRVENFGFLGSSACQTKSESA